MGKPDEEAMNRAIECYRSENISIRDAATRYGVKKSTLIDRLSGKGNKVGTPTLLSPFTEMLIVQLLISCSDIGFSLNRHETLDVVASYLKETKQEKLFKKSRPSDDWYYDFIARHKKELAIRNCSNMPCNRAMSCDPVMFKSWFDKVNQFYDEKNFHEKPCHIFNCDEIGMICDKGKFRVVTRKGNKL
jgi:hypothetical protein